MSVELKIGNGYLTNSIYIGKVRTYKDGHQEWQDDRVDVTKEAVCDECNHRFAYYTEYETAVCPICGELYYTLDLNPPKLNN